MMPEVTTEPAPPRVLGRVRGDAAGPTLVVVGSIHGNEPAGSAAAARVMRELQGREGRLRGEVLALTGNRKALARRMRFIDHDLNRIWSQRRIDDLRRGRPGLRGAEDEEQLEILGAVNRAFAEARGQVYFLDLHTTSASGYPFALASNEPAEREFARHFPIPVILGLLTHLGGLLLDYMRRQGAITFGVEAGRNDDPRSVVRHEAVMWLALVAAGLLEAHEVPDLADRWTLLERARGGLPRTLQVLGRYAIEPEDAFRMAPGFENISAVREGRVLAHDRRGPVRAPSDGYVLMPLYQQQGDDGFFFARAVE